MQIGWPGSWLLLSIPDTAPLRRRKPGWSPATRLRGWHRCIVPFQYPEVFGISYSQSGYLSLDSDTMIEAFSEVQKRPIRLYVDVGVFERKVGWTWLPDDEIDFTAGNRRFRTVLEQERVRFRIPRIPRRSYVGKLASARDRRDDTFFPK